MATGKRGDDGYVFAKPDGSPIHPDLISQTFEPGHHIFGAAMCIRYRVISYHSLPQLL